ncbi:MAG: branched-chain amino acid aminotransferase [Hyphomicrobiaceae bacterium]|jgi:branched-chain amino acid aminotransferase
MKVWIDGEIVDGSEAKVPVVDHGLLYGDGIFEGMRVYAGQVFRISRHLDRLGYGAKSLALDLPHTRDEITQIVKSTVSAFGETEAYIRLIVTRGDGPLGVDPLTCPRPRLICIVAAIRLFNDEQRATGLNMITSSLRRPGPDVVDPNVKSLNYINSVLAKLEARQRHADEALMLAAGGYIAEAAVANVFLVHGDVLSTPPTSDGCLAGINRAAVLELAPSLGLQPVERRLTRSDVFSADEMFLTGSGAGVIAVRSLDERKIGEGLRGPKTAIIEIAHRELAEREARAATAA